MFFHLYIQTASLRVMSRWYTLYSIYICANYTKSCVVMPLYIGYQKIISKPKLLVIYEVQPINKFINRHHLFDCNLCNILYGHYGMYVCT